MLGYFIVSLLWGCSNPFIKHAQLLRSSRVEEVDREESEKDRKSIFSNLKSLTSDKKMLLPFLVNQSGSLVFFILLSSEPVSIASPVCNSLTFVVTAVTSYALFNEVVRNPFMLVIGTLFIISGTSLCMIS
jgi:hypothetical protein